MAEALLVYGRQRAQGGKKKQAYSDLIAGDLVGRRRKFTRKKLFKTAALTAVNPAAGAGYAAYQMRGDLVGKRFKVKKLAKVGLKTAVKAATSKQGMFVIGAATGAGGVLATQQAAKSGIVGKAKAKVTNMFADKDDAQISALQKQLADQQSANAAQQAQFQQQQAANAAQYQQQMAALQAQQAQAQAAQQAQAQAAQQAQAQAAQQAQMVQAAQQMPVVQYQAPVIQTVAASVPTETAQKISQVYTDIPAVAQTATQAASNASDVLSTILPQVKKYAPYAGIGLVGLLAWKLLK